MKKLIFTENVLLVLLVIGIPNFFIVYDASNIAKGDGLGLDLNIIIRFFIMLIIVLYISVNIVRCSKLPKNKIQVFSLPVIFYLLYLFTIPIFQDGTDALKSSYRIIEYFLFFIFLFFYQKSIGNFNLSKLYKILELVFNYIIFIVIIGLLFFNSRMIGLVEMDETYIRLGGSVIHPNTLGTISVIAILYYSFISKSRTKVLMFLFILLFTFSRGAMFSLFVSVLVPYIFLSKNRHFYHFLLVIFILPAFIVSMDLLVSILGRGQGLEGFITLSGRMVVWMSSIDLITQNTSNFFIGISFGEASEIIGEVMSNNYNIDYWKSHNAHNDFLQAWLGGGIFFFLFTIYIYINVYSKIKVLESYKERFFVVGLLSVIFTFSISMTTINYYLSTFSALFWLLYVSVINQVKDKEIIR